MEEYNVQTKIYMEFILSKIRYYNKINNILLEESESVLICVIDEVNNSVLNYCKQKSLIFRFTVL